MSCTSCGHPVQAMGSQLVPAFISTLDASRAGPSHAYHRNAPGQWSSIHHLWKWQPSSAESGSAAAPPIPTTSPDALEQGTTTTTGSVIILIILIVILIIIVLNPMPMAVFMSRGRRMMNAYLGRCALRSTGWMHIAAWSGNTRRSAHIPYST